jgi:HSP20 family protein
MTNTIATSKNRNVYTGFGNVIDDIFQNRLRHFFDGNAHETKNDWTTGPVPVNIRETERQYELDVIAPGCRKEDFSIHIDNNILTVLLQKKEPTGEKEQPGWVRKEFVQRPFERSFTLDETVDVNKIAANYTDGILRIALGKNELAKMVSRQIAVN